MDTGPVDRLRVKRRYPFETALRVLRCFHEGDGSEIENAFIFRDMLPASLSLIVHMSAPGACESPGSLQCGRR
jgi:hypothetical protein